MLWIFELHNEPAPGNGYLFNGDMADRGANAVEIFMLLLAYKLACPEIIFMNRGNHEQRDLNERPFANGGGFAWECRRPLKTKRRLALGGSSPHLRAPCCPPATHGVVTGALQMAA